MAWAGIDQSYTGFGVTVINATSGEHTSLLGKFDAAKYGTGVGRLMAIESWLYNALSGWDIDHVCMEGYANGAKFGREAAGELGYAVKRALYVMHPQYLIPTIVPPTSVKKFCTGSGAAKKNEILLGVYKRWGVEFKDDNLADSYVLAKIAQAIDTEADDLPKFQQEVLAKLAN